MDLMSLPEELILQIFKYCDIESLGRLSCTCSKFEELIRTSNGIWLEKSRFVLGSNMRHPVMKRRCKPYLTPKMRCQLSKSWKYCIGNMRMAYRYPQESTDREGNIRCMPWLQLEEANYLHSSIGGSIVKLRRNAAGDVVHPRQLMMSYPMNEDITKLVVNGEKIVASFTNGIIGCWRKCDLRFIDSFEAHYDKIYSVHVEGNFMISGSRDRKFKVWRTDFPQPQRQYTRFMGNRVLSTSILPSSRYFLIGLSGTNYVNPLQLYDIERGICVTTFGDHFLLGAGILDLYAEDPFTFLSCGYDSTVKLWDIRCPVHKVCEWVDPYDNVVTCVTSDHNVTVVSGANHHGLVHVWDKRRNTLSQFIRQIYHEDSPVYSVAFDATHVFAALDKGVMQYSFNF